MCMSSTCMCNIRGDIVATDAKSPDPYWKAATAEDKHQVVRPNTHLPSQEVKRVRGCRASGSVSCSQLAEVVRSLPLHLLVRGCRSAVLPFYLPTVLDVWCCHRPCPATRHPKLGVGEISGAVDLWAASFGQHSHIFRESWWSHRVGIGWRRKWRRSGRWEQG